MTLKFRINWSVLAVIYGSDGNFYESENEIEIVQDISIKEEIFKIPLTVLVVGAIMVLVPQRAYASYLLMDKTHFRDKSEEYPTLGKYFSSFLDKSEWSKSIKYRKMSRYTGHLIDVGIGLGITYVAGRTHMSLMHQLKGCKSDLMRKHLESISQKGLLKRYRDENIFLKKRQCLDLVVCETPHDSLLPKIIESTIVDLDK